MVSTLATSHPILSASPEFISGYTIRIDSSLEPTVSHLVTVPSTGLKNHQKRCCRTSTSSGYSSHSPPLSAGTYSSACGLTSGILAQRNPTSSNNNNNNSGRINRADNGTGAQHQQIVGVPGLAVIYEAETIPRPIWPCMANDIQDIHTSAARCDMLDCEVAVAHVATGPDHCHQDLYACCNYCCVCSAYVHRNSCGTTSAASSSARDVLLELSRTLNSVIDAGSDLSTEEILRDISITVARGIQSRDPPSSGMCEDYAYRLASSSSSAGGKESIGVNPVNLRVYSKPKWVHVPASSRSSSHCPCEEKTLLTAVRHASRTQPNFGGPSRAEQNLRNDNEIVTPAVFLVRQENSEYSTAPTNYPSRNSKVTHCKGGRKTIEPGKLGGANRTRPRLNAGPGENFGDKCSAKEPVYSMQLDASDESSSYGVLGESPAKKEGWNERTKFDRDLDFTLDGNRAERLGRAIANAKRKRQWCRGLTAIIGLVFFVLSVVVVSLSVTRGRKVFGSM